MWSGFKSFCGVVQFGSVRLSAVWPGLVGFGLGISCLSATISIIINKIQKIAKLRLQIVFGMI